jgi:hypothetical protein
MLVVFVSILWISGSGFMAWIVIEIWKHSVTTPASYINPPMPILVDKPFGKYL